MDSDLLAERYGRGRQRGNRVVLIVVITTAVLVVAWFVWAVWVALHPKVTSGLETWEAIDANTVEVTFRVSVHDDDVTPTCTVEAEDAHEMKVGGLTDFEAEAGRQTVRIKTDREAARVEWAGCLAPGQDDPK